MGFACLNERSISKADMKIWGLVTDKEDNKLKGYTLKL
jgi:hypothetical protein